MRRNDLEQLKLFGAFTGAVLLTLFVVNAGRIWTALSTNFTQAHSIYASVATVLEAIVVAVSAFVAYLAYKAVMRTAAKQNTINLLFQEHTDREVTSQRAGFRSIKYSDDKMENFITAEDRTKYVNKKIRDAGHDPKTFDRAAHADQIAKWEKDFTTRQTALFGVLNRYETFAIGIKEEAIDPRIYKDWWKSSFINDWHLTRAAIKKIRESNGAPEAYVQFSRLAKRWEEEDEKKSKT
jgi:hypothetical protein